ncbi:MAG: large protein [Bacteroidetes bacterium]|nr:large protein [Bacteroidota bacterium]
MSAQDIEYTLHVTDVSCNGIIAGTASVIVNNTHPPYVYLWNTGSTDHEITDLVPGDYSVTVTDVAGNDTLITVRINEALCHVSPEQVFTPNGDAHNDSWAIVNIEYFPDNLILVYNRWGQKVYEHRGAYEPWDGKDLLGVPVPDNSYFYIIYEDNKKENTIVKGCVSIIR